jgi:phosphoglycerol transferase MdoB-like AlkP superfamily enzyme
MYSIKNNLFLFLKRIFLVLIIYQICRILFFLYNKHLFTSVSVIEFIGGIRFDLSAIAYINLVFVILHFLPLKAYCTETYQKFLSITFYIVNLLFILTNFIDFEYFKFTNRRSTYSLITASGMGQEIGGLLQSYIIDYWYIPVNFIILAVLFWKLLPKAIYFKQKIYPHFYRNQTILLFTFLCVFIVVGRGGLQKKPIRIVDSNLYASNESTAIVLNTPFTIIKTIDNKEKLESYNFYTETELDQIFNPIQQFKKSDSIKKNVVILILESFGKENLYIGQTPFLDSLTTKSLNFTNAYANGRLSIDAVPSIISSIPSLMNSSLISSSYSVNKIKALPKILEENGYNTSFFHGAFNGSQNFDKYCKQVGFDKYYGKNEYTGEDAFDGKWGVFDEEFLQFFAHEVSTFKQPFLTSLFTISSHAPFIIPEKYKDKFPKGTTQFHETISYTDFALQQFFETAKTKPWYKNTIFIITADHTSSAKKTGEFNTPIGMFKIPLLIFDPGSQNYVGENNKLIQQIDILPSIIDILGIEQTVLSYGKSYLDSRNFVVTYSNNTYNYICDDYYLAFNGKKSVKLYNIKKDPLLKNNLIDNPNEAVTQQKMEHFLKAYIQSFNTRMTQNKLTVN